MSVPSFLSPEALQAWRSRGFLVVEDALDATARGSLRAWAEAMARPPRVGEQRLQYFERIGSAAALCRTERFLDDDSDLRALLVGGAVPAIAGVLLGAEATLYKEKLNCKPPGGAGFAPHQDAVAYPNVSQSITCLIAVEAMTPENGCLEFAAGHITALLPTDAAGCVAPDVVESLDWQAVPLMAGAALFFTSFVPHRSGPNRTAAPRRAFYLTYNPLSEGDLRADYYRMRAARLAAAEASGMPARISLIGHFQGEPA